MQQCCDNKCIHVSFCGHVHNVPLLNKTHTMDRKPNRHTDKKLLWDSEEVIKGLIAGEVETQLIERVCRAKAKQDLFLPGDRKLWVGRSFFITSVKAFAKHRKTFDSKLDCLTVLPSSVKTIFGSCYDYCDEINHVAELSN